MLAAPTEYLLASGGDSRLYLDPVHLLNGYGCRPWPQPEIFTFASSTATLLSPRGFTAAAAAQQQLIELSAKLGLESACDLLLESVRQRIRSALKLDRAETEIVFSPSGTDSQVQALFIAQSILGGPVVNVIVASDETGSGTPCSTTGHHFNWVTAQGDVVPKEERIEGFPDDTTSIEIPLRDGLGRLQSPNAIDEQVMAAVERSITLGKRVILHVMDSSKFGSRCPSLECIEQIRVKRGPYVQIVVDACQIRLGRRRLRYYLSQNFLVLITGSKFFAGPPLSGALLIPPRVSERMSRVENIPAGLGLYTSRNDWPVAWHGIRSKLPSHPNVGQLLRWVAATEEMKAYFAVPQDFRFRALRIFSRIVPGMIAESANLELLPISDDASGDGIDDEEMALRTIFPFLVRCGGRRCSLEECSLIYRALNWDISNVLPRSAASQQRQVAAQCCHIGQPVTVKRPDRSEAGTLRISAGARVVSDSWSTAGLAASLRKLDGELDQVLTIIQKIEIIAQCFDAISEMDELRSLKAISRAPSLDGLAAGGLLPIALLNRSSDPVRSGSVRPRGMES